MSRRSRTAYALTAVTAAGLASASAHSMAGDLRVNTYVTGSQGSPAIAADAQGNFVVVWWSANQDGDSNGVFGRLFDAAGTPLGGEFQVNSYTTGNQRHPAVAMRASGEFVVVWQSPHQDGSFGGIFGQLYDAAGNRVGPEFQVNADSMNTQRRPSLAMDGSGGFVVVWEGYSYTGLWDVWGRRFDGSGVPLTGDLLLNGESAAVQVRPKVASDAAGNFVVVWQSDVPPITGCGPHPAFARRFDASGTPQGPDFAISSDSTSVVRPSVGMTESGAFMVAWESGGCFNREILARVFDASGEAVGSDFVVDDAPAPPEYPDSSHDRSYPAVAADEAGDFVVAWLRSTYSESSEGYYNIHARVRTFDGSGNALGPGSPANRAGGPDAVAVAARPAGRFVVAWNSFADVFARPADVVFLDGFESRDLSSWSSSATDGGDLAVTFAASLGGSRAGLQATVDDRAGIYVQDDTPTQEPRYRARFHLDPNGYDPGEAQDHFRQQVFIAFADAPLKRLVMIVLKRQGGAYSIAASVRNDDNTQAMTPFVPIADGPNTIEFDWQQATGPATGDGRLELWINDASAATLTGLDNDARAIDFVRLGAMSVKPGASGTLFLDEFVSRRTAFIGP